MARVHLSIWGLLRENIEMCSDEKRDSGFVVSANLAVPFLHAGERGGATEVEQKQHHGTLIAHQRQHGDELFLPS